MRLQVPLVSFSLDLTSYRATRRHRTYRDLFSGSLTPCSGFSRSVSLPHYLILRKLYHTPRCIIVWFVIIGSSHLPAMPLLCWVECWWPTSTSWDCQPLFWVPSLSVYVHLFNSIAVYTGSLAPFQGVIHPLIARLIWSDKCTSLSPYRFCTNFNNFTAPYACNYGCSETLSLHQRMYVLDFAGGGAVHMLGIYSTVLERMQHWYIAKMHSGPANSVL